jgi:L-ascorbate metabolism protein UlaG (beta-lactamase superfamily)
MKITKFVHSCLLVEMPEPVNRTVLFDPGIMSEEALNAHQFEFLDDIVITHMHPDHFHVPVIKKLVEQFPDVRILAPEEVTEKLKAENIEAQTTPPEGMELFDAPHEEVEPMFPLPQEIGVHYLDKLTDPGDSHSFTETKEILALPVQAPWGSTLSAVRLALKLKPKHILPIHDWHWSDAARTGMYDQLEGLFAEQGITFHKLETATPVVIEV